MRLNPIFCHPVRNCPLYERGTGDLLAVERTVPYRMTNVECAKNLNLLLLSTKKIAGAIAMNPPANGF